MSEQSGGRVTTPVQCALDRKMLKEVHLAVCGDERLGIPGLVGDVRDLKSWRRKLDLRVAGVAGIVSSVPWLFAFLKYISNQ